MPAYGLVVDRGRRPVGGAMASVERASVPVQELAYGTDAAGRFVVAPPPGRFLLAAHAPDGTKATRETVVHEHRTPGPPLVRVTPSAADALTVHRDPRPPVIATRAPRA